MGFSKAIIAIKGNHLDHLEKVTAILNYFYGVDVIATLDKRSTIVRIIN